MTLPFVISSFVTFFSIVNTLSLKQETDVFNWLLAESRDRTCPMTWSLGALLLLLLLLFLEGTLSFTELFAERVGLDTTVAPCKIAAPDGVTDPLDGAVRPLIRAIIFATEVDERSISSAVLEQQDSSDAKCFR